MPQSDRPREPQLLPRTPHPQRRTPLSKHERRSKVPSADPRAARVRPGGRGDYFFFRFFFLFSFSRLRRSLMASLFSGLPAVEPGMA
jgi:hypothetical protein